MFFWLTYLPHDSSLWFPVLLRIMGILTIIAGVAVGLFFIRKCRERQWGSCRSLRRMDGKVVIITGANSGIGKEAAGELASRGAVVVLACRNPESAIRAKRDIRLSTADGELICIELDLGSIASIERCARNILSKFECIHVLINNAGVFVPLEEKQMTSDGFEIHFGVNHLGHFHLTQLLMDRIASTPDSRIINVSSLLYKKGKIDFDNLNAEHGWDGTTKHNVLYSNSKLANIHHAQELSKRLRGKKVGVFALCPGFVYTNLMRHTVGKYGLVQKLLFLPVIFLFMRTARQGCQTTVHCAVSEDLDSLQWGFFQNCRLSALEAFAEDELISVKLWEVSVQLIELARKSSH